MGAALYAQIFNPARVCPTICGGALAKPTKSRVGRMQYRCFDKNRYLQEVRRRIFAIFGRARASRGCLVWFFFFFRKSTRST